jgi:hypothetical protein
MTIEIKQLIIRAVTDGRREPAGHPAASPAAVAPGPWPAPASASHRAAPGEERDAIVAACVREVLRRLERKRER